MVDGFLVRMFQLSAWAVLLSGAVAAGGGFMLLLRILGYDWVGWVVAAGWFLLFAGMSFLGWGLCVLAARLADYLADRVDVEP